MKPPHLVQVGTQLVDRRDVLRLLALGSVVSASGLMGCASGLTQPARNGSDPGPRQLASSRGVPPAPDFLFLQLSDTHWGYGGPNNPEGDITLTRAVREINASPLNPDFIVFTGDLTHTTDDPTVRRRRMHEFRAIVADLKVRTLYFLPGEHDAGPDEGEAYREIFGETHAAFDHKGVHFVMLDNVSAPGSRIGEGQLEWLARDVSALAPTTPLVVFTHRPLFDLYPSWDWMTLDGRRALEILASHSQATVFYGHIHQEHHVRTASITHHAARSLIFPLPAPGSVPKKAPLAWDPTSPDHGLGYRRVQERAGMPELDDIALGPEPQRQPPA